MSIYAKRNDCLVIWLLWVDDLLVTGIRNNVVEAEHSLKGFFESENLVLV